MTWHSGSEIEQVDDGTLLVAVILWAIALLTLVFGTSFLRFVMGQFVRESKYVAKSTGSEVAETMGLLFRRALQRRVARRLSYVFTGSLLYAGVWVLANDDETEQAWKNALNVVATLCKIFVMYCILRAQLAAIDALCDVMVDFTAKTPSQVDDEIVPVIQEISKLLSIVYWLVMILQAAGIDMTMAIASLTVGTAVFALACQDYVRCFFGLFLLLYDRPFEIGDAIDFKATSGIVHAVSLRTTIVKKYDGTFSFIPNGEFLTNTIVNISRRKGVRFSNDWQIEHSDSSLTESIQTMRSQLTAAIGEREQFKDQYCKVRLSIQRGCVSANLTAVSTSVTDWDQYCEDEAWVTCTIADVMARNNLKFFVVNHK